MSVRTFRAKTMQAALEAVRAELGPDAVVMRSRELAGRTLRRLFRTGRFEITAQAKPVTLAATSTPSDPVPAHLELDHRQRFRRQLQQTGTEAGAGALDLGAPSLTRREIPPVGFGAFAELLDAGVSDGLAREFVFAALASAGADRDRLRTDLASSIQNRLATTGGIQPLQGARHVVALVGPTGVGKTTTVAKLAANFRLREGKKVGLITVDTYRVAAVDQLRTYADIIDLPMEVVASPKDMREALARLSEVDVVLIDTAGRSPRDEIRIQELRAMLTEACPDEVHLVLSTAASTRHLEETARRFASVGVDAILLTKLDEAIGLGHVLDLLEAARLPISYLTDGQDVPDDLAIAEAPDLARQIVPELAHPAI